MDLDPALLHTGKLVVLLPDGAERTRLEVRFVERCDAQLVYLEPPAFFLDDDDVTERCALGEVGLWLREPVIEAGDAIVWRGRPGRIARCLPNDMHVYVTLDDTPHTEQYTNLIHVDFSPTLATLPR